MDAAVALVLEGLSPRSAWEKSGEPNGEAGIQNIRKRAREVKQKAADMKWWVDDILQVILWVGSARPGKASRAKAKAKAKAKARVQSWIHGPPNQWS